MRATASLAFAAALAGLSWADPLPERARAIADYAIQVRLDPDAKTLAGTERITWRNPADEPVGELWFHLYLNAFKNSESTFFKESGGQLRGDRMPEDGWGYTDVTSLRLASGADLLPGARFEHPDDDNAADETVWRVPLPEPVPPGGTVVLELAFEAKLPRVFARTGYFRDYFLVGQWFPKLGVYEPRGARGRESGGWNCHQFHANSEFYADFGRYDVEITLPKRFVVGATGARSERRENPDGTSTHVFAQENVIDFAWTASPRFVEVKARFSAQNDVTAQEYAEAEALLGRSPEDVRLGDVDVTLLLQPERASQAERQLRAAKAAIKWFGLWYGRYPYATLTVVDPAFGASGSGGMEYPTFITGGSSALLNLGPFAGVMLVEEVIVHEFGHQYWQSMVASNEFEESWLDEGFNSYSTGRVMEKAYGPWMVQLLGLRLGGLELARLPNSVERMFDRIRSPAWGYSSGNYGFNSYARTQLTLLTLESILGPQTMARAMRTYHERFRFRHPSSDDFYAVVSEVAGRDMSGFFAQTTERPGIVDYEVSKVTSKRAPEPRGIFGAGEARTTVTREQADEKQERADAAGTRRWVSELTVRRRGDVALPVALRLEYEGGATQEIALSERDEAAYGVERLELLRGAAGAEPWRGRFKRLELTSDERLAAASVDPDDLLKLDVNRLNNSRRSEPDTRAASRLGVRMVFWLQQLLGLAGL